MAGNQVTSYAAVLRADLAGRGVAAPPLDELVAAAQAFATALDQPPGQLTPAGWAAASDRWVAAREAVAGQLAGVLLGVLAEVPGLAELVADTGALQREGVHGEVDLGPVHFRISSMTLVVQPQGS
jgi:hypothetical protein